MPGPNTHTQFASGKTRFAQSPSEPTRTTDDNHDGNVAYEIEQTNCDQETHTSDPDASA